MRVSTLSLAMTAINLANITPYKLTKDEDAAWLFLPNFQPTFPKAKRAKKGKPKNRPSRRQRMKFKRR